MLFDILSYDIFGELLSYFTDYSDIIMLKTLFPSKNIEEHVKEIDNFDYDEETINIKLFSNIESIKVNLNLIDSNILDIAQLNKLRKCIIFMSDLDEYIIMMFFTNYLAVKRDLSNIIIRFCDLDSDDFLEFRNGILTLIEDTQSAFSKKIFDFYISKLHLSKIIHDFLDPYVVPKNIEVVICNSDSTYNLIVNMKISRLKVLNIFDRETNYLTISESSKFLQKVSDFSIQFDKIFGQFNQLDWIESLEYPLKLKHIRHIHKLKNVKTFYFHLDDDSQNYDFNGFIEIANKYQNKNFIFWTYPFVTNKLLLLNEFMKTNILPNNVYIESIPIVGRPCSREIDCFFELHNEKEYFSKQEIISKKRRFDDFSSS